MKNKKLTIVKVLYARPHIGGSGRMGIEIALEMAKRGHNVHIISYPNTFLSEEEKEFLHIHQIPEISYSSFKVPPTGLVIPSKIKSLAENMNIDILHAHYAITHGEGVVDGRDLIKFEKKQGKLPNQINEPVAVITCHGTDISINGYKDAIGPSLNYRLNQADKVTFVSNSLKEEALKMFDLNDFCCDVIYNFVDDDKFIRENSDVMRNNLRERLDIPKDATVFYHISNFREVKNTDVIIKAMNLIINDFDLNSYLVLIGDGPDRVNIENLVKKYNLQNKVKFIGSLTPELIPQYSQMGDVLLLPSKKEAFGLVILEAMFLENAVIASNIGGIPEVVEHNGSGFLFEPKNYSKLANYMKFFIINKAEIKNFGKRGLEIAKSKFSKKKICDIYENMYYEILEKNRNEGELLPITEFGDMGV